MFAATICELTLARRLLASLFGNAPAVLKSRLNGWRWRSALFESPDHHCASNNSERLRVVEEAPGIEALRLPSTIIVLGGDGSRRNRAARRGESEKLSQSTGAAGRGAVSRAGALKSHPDFGKRRQLKRAGSA